MQSNFVAFWPRHCLTQSLNAKVVMEFEFYTYDLWTQDSTRCLAPKSHNRPSRNRRQIGLKIKCLYNLKTLLQTRAGIS